MKKFFGNTIFLTDRGHSAGPSFLNLNYILRGEDATRWIPPVKTHACMRSALDLEYARLRK
jgi:hypothetical protein